MSALLELNIRRSSKELSSLAAIIGKSDDSRKRYHAVLEAFDEVFSQIDAPSVKAGPLSEAAAQLLEKAQRLNDSGDNLDVKQMSTQFATRIKGLKPDEVAPFVAALKKANIKAFADLLKEEFPAAQKAQKAAAADDNTMLLMDIRKSTKELAALASLIGKSAESRKKYHAILEAFGGVFEQLYAPSVNINALNAAAELLLEKAQRLNDSGENLDIKRHSSQFATRIRSLKASEVRDFVLAFKKADTKAFNDLLDKELAAESQPEECIPTIFSVDFRDSKNENDQFGKVISTTTRYLSPRVRYTLPFTPKTPVKISYRIFSPDGKMEKNDSHQDGFLNTEELTSTTGSIVLGGWGNDRGTAYYEGRWRFELYCGSKLIHTDYFDVKSPFSHIPPSIDIQSVEFGNTDKDNNVINEFGSELPVNTQYLEPRIHFTVRNLENRQIDLRYIIYDSNGVPFKNSSRNDRYTVSTQFNLMWKSPYKMPGFGNSQGNCYLAGRYKVEFYEGDYLLHTAYATIGKPYVPKPAPVYTASPYSDKDDSSGGKGCLLTILITAVVLAGIYGVMKWWGSDDSDSNEDAYRYVMASQVFLRSSPDSESNANIITKYPYGTRLEYLGDIDNWLEVKEPESGKTGYVSKDYVLGSSDFNHLDSIWGSRAIIDDVSMTRHRMALLDFYNEKKPEMGGSYFQLEAPSSNWLEKAVKDGYDIHPEFAFIVKDAQTGARKTAIYSFLHGESPLLRHVEDAPAVGGIKDISYRSGSGYTVSYGTRKAKSKKSRKKSSSGASGRSSESVVVEESPAIGSIETVAE